MTNKKKKDGINPVAAAVTGAVVGGIAAAGAMTLSDEKKREQIKNSISEAKEKAIGYMQEAREKAEDAKKDVSKKIMKGKDILENSAEKVRGTVEETVDDMQEIV